MDHIRSNIGAQFFYFFLKATFRIGFIWSFFCFTPFILLAQDYTLNLQAFDVEDGLLHRYVTSVFEDKDGLIWVGSSKGLQRFDGHNFKSWTAQSTPQGKINHITAIGQDKEGWLWLWNNHSYEFVFLHPETEITLSEEERFGSDFPIKKKTDNTGWHGASSGIPTDSKGRLYFVSSVPNKLIVYDTKKGFINYPLPTLKSDFIELYFIDSKDNLWITESYTNSILYKIDTIGNILNTYDHRDMYDVYGFSESHGNVYYETNKEVELSRYYYKVDSSGESELIYKKKKKRGNIRTNSTFIWDFEKDGWRVYARDETKPIFVLPVDQVPQQFKSVNFSCYEDSQGRYWFPGDWGLGLAVIKPSRFQKYFSFNNEQEKPINNSARGILVDKDTIYTNFEFGGLVSISKNNPSQWNIIYRSESSREYVGRPLAKAVQGGLYIGYDKNSIKHIDPASSFKTSLTFQGGSTIGHKAAWSFYTDPEKTLWVGMDEGLAYKNPDKDYFQLIEDGGFFNEGEVIQHIYPDKVGRLWLSGIKGLYLFDPESKSFLGKYGNLEKGKFYLPTGTFYNVYIDRSGIFWIGTNKGLLQWDRTNNKQKLFTTIDGFSNDVIYAIFEDDYNKLWLSSDNGIMQFDKETYHVNAFLEKDGIAHREFNRTSAYKDESGIIYFGGLNGITAFHPKDFVQVENQNSIPMTISDFEIFDGESSELISKVGELRMTNTIDYYPNDRFFRLTFALPIYENAKNISYAWKVDGVDKEWNYQKDNTLQIGKLPYGRHTLKIKGQSDNGTWSPHELAIRVNVFKPFFLQFWFIALSGLALLLLALGLFKWRTRQLKYRQDILEEEIQKATTKIGKQAEELKQLDKVKSRFFANVSHELRTPLTLMLGPISSILKNNKLNNKDFVHLKKAQQNGKELLKLVASILNLSKLESGKLELQEKPELLFPLVRRLSSAFESHAEREGIRFSFIYNAEKDLQLELDKGKLEIIINNLLSNALKFSQSGGQVSVSVEDIGKAIRIAVKDKGRGIHVKDLPHVFDRFYQSGQADAPTEGGTGIGLALSQELVQVMGGKIWVESEWGSGSSFFVEFPRKEIFGIAIPVEEQVLEATQQIATPIIIAPQKEIQEAANTQRPTILIVEDNHSLRDYLKTILESYYTVWTAENGLVALDLLKDNKESLPSLVLSDIMMPVMDGFQLLEVLKSRAYFRHLPVIMLTARADIQDKIKALRIGVDDYLLKPFEEDELLARVENILNNYQERIMSQRIYTEEEETKVLNPSQSESTKKIIPVVSVEDTQWLAELESYLKQHLSNNKYSISQLALDLAISERQLRRRLKTLTGLSPVQYLKEARLQEARQILEQRKFKTVAQTAGAVGFQDPGAFSRNFSNRFGKMPSEYLQD